MFIMGEHGCDIIIYFSAVTNIKKLHLSTLCASLIAIQVRNEKIPFFRFTKVHLRDL